jgi:hypothetical protein
MEKLLSTRFEHCMTSPMKRATGGMQTAAFPIASNRSSGTLNYVCVELLQCKRRRSAPPWPSSQTYP